MLLVTRYALGISQESLIWETARVFGLNHSAESVPDVFTEILRRLVRDRKLILKEGVVTVA
jgi:hypothetical protein